MDKIGSRDKKAGQTKSRGKPKGGLPKGGLKGAGMQRLWLNIRDVVLCGQVLLTIRVFQLENDMRLE